MLMHKVKFDSNPKKKHSQLKTPININIPKNISDHFKDCEILVTRTFLNSVDDESCDFTNMLPQSKEDLEYEILEKIKNFNVSKRTIFRTCREIKIYGKNKERLTKIFSSYLGKNEFYTHQDHFFESDMTPRDSSSKNRGKFRIISFWETIDTPYSIKKTKDILVLVCIDSYHLLMPTSPPPTMYSKTKKHSVKNFKQEYQKYSKKRNYNSDFKTHFSQYFETFSGYIIKE